MRDLNSKPRSNIKHLILKLFNSKIALLQCSTTERSAIEQRFKTVDENESSHQNTFRSVCACFDQHNSHIWS